MNKLLIIATLLIGTVAVATSVANATTTQEQSQEASQKGTQKCEFVASMGQYGGVLCTQEFDSKLSQQQSQTVAGRVLGDEDVYRRRVHIPVNTAVDTRTMMAALGVTAVGGAAYAVRRKIA